MYTSLHRYKTNSRKDTLINDALKGHHNETQATKYFYLLYFDSIIHHQQLNLKCTELSPDRSAQQCYSVTTKCCHSANILL